ncbi:MAG: IS21 family transposase [Planctomycetota bacterium]|jgi:transposase
MTTFLTVRALLEEGVPKKTIARRLGIDRRTVRKYARRIAQGAAGPERAAVPHKLDLCRARIEEKTRQGLSAVQIWQDLREEVDGFDASYSTVRRLVQALRVKQPEVYCRMRYAPGEEVQVDFGEVGRVPVDGKTRKIYLFVLTLCWSRYAYYELVLDQTVPTFLGALRRGFEFFGGVPERLKPDNLKAAVLLDQLGQRYYQEDFFRFCRHYGTLPDAARPHTPTDKGRCERDIGYAKGNCFRGRDFASLEAAQAHLARWRDAIANVRLHGTTQRRPQDLFAREKAHLRPLPDEPYVVCEWGLYKVRKDCHFALQGNHYSAPYRFVGERVLVRLGEARVTLFAGGEKVADHARAQGRGHTVTDESHYPPTKRLATQEIRRRRVLAIRAAGPHAAQFLSRLTQARFVKADQIARLARLVATYGESAVDQACRRALHFDAIEGAPTVERILERGLHTRPLPGIATPAASAGRDFGRPLQEYKVLLGGGKEVA